MNAHRTATERAECADCSFEDDKPGARGRGGRHAKRTGHEIRLERVTVIHRRGAPEAQTVIPALEESS